MIDARFALFNIKRDTANCQTDGGMRHLQLDLSTLNRRCNLSTKLFDRGVAGDTLMSHDGRLLKHAEEIDLGKGASY
jgi:hypothetical protein